VKSATIIAGALCLFAATAQAKDVPMAPAEYRMFNVYASRGHEKQCVAVTDAKDLLARFTGLGVNKPEAVLGLIEPPIDWQQSAVVLLYQPDPPPDVVPKVRSLLKDVNKEKLTVLFRYADPNEPAPAPEPVAAAQPRPSPPALSSRFTMKAYTVGTDDTRDRAGLRSPLLLVVLPKLGFLTSKSLVECTQKL
jgi:hypothetical protein